jgi:hypothetical protein
MLLRLFERRLAESSWLSFNPALPAAPASKGGWTMDVLGNPVDPLSVAFNGSRHFHAVHRGVCYEAESAAATTRLAIDTLDAPLVAPGDTAHLLDFDNTLPALYGSESGGGGFHFNLHNNAGWDCSAPWWYDKDASFRFALRLNPQEKAGCW